MIDVVLIVMGLTLLAAIGAITFSSVRNLRQGVSGYHKTTWVALGILIVSLLVGLIFGSGSAMQINGKTFADALWLRLSDVLIISSAILFVLACIGVAYSELKK